MHAGVACTYRLGCRQGVAYLSATVLGLKWVVCAAQVDPDADVAEAERTNGKSSAAGLTCGGPPTAEKALDF